MKLTCQKCGKEYKSRYHYENHIKKCTGKPSKKKITKKKTSVSSKNELNNLKIKVENIEQRLIKIETILQDINRKSFGKKDSVNITKFDDFHDFHKELVKIINERPQFKQIRGNYVLKEIRNIFLHDYKMSQKEFEENILKLYRKELIDLQPGGNKFDYHLSLPTGAKFYYLIING